jgi:CTP-dependent riboflavin kinase
MDYIIKGHVTTLGVKKAGERLKKCQEALKPYGITFPPYICGTLNVELQQEFLTPDWPNIILISREEIDKYDPGYDEWWKLIPIKKINNQAIPAFILRPEKTCHPNSIVEIVAHKIDFLPDSEIELLLSDGRN